MSTTITEQVASYIYDKDVSYGAYNVFACYDSINDYDNRKADFYDVYDNSGVCVNEGNPFYELPSWKEIYYHYYLPSMKQIQTQQ